MFNKTRLKICCISSIEEMLLATELGADIIGLVAEHPSGPGTIDDEKIKQIAQATPANISTFLLTCRTEAQDIVDHVTYCGTDSVQLTQHIDVSEHKKLDTLLPSNIQRIQVIHVEDESCRELVDLYAPYVDAFLLDSGKPNAAIAELGGTGRTHDWEISAQIVQQTDKPVYLAGGLKAENVAQAIEQVQPYGLDLCSGVRKDGKLDREKLAAYITATGR